MRIRRHEIAVSEAEILEMTEDLDQMHNDQGVPALQTSMAEWHDQIRSGTSKPTSRRTFLLGVGGAVAGAGVLAVVGGTPGLAAAATSAPVTPATSGNPEAGLTGDLAVAALAASLENLAIYTYQSAISAATAGKLGTVPPAVVTFAQTALSATHIPRCGVEQPADRQRQEGGDGYRSQIDPDGPDCLWQGDQRHRARRAGADAREHRGPDLSGRGLNAEEQEGHPGGIDHCARRNAARGDPVLRAGHVPRGPDGVRNPTRRSTRPPWRPERGNLQPAPARVSPSRAGAGLHSPQLTSPALERSLP